MTMAALGLAPGALRLCDHNDEWARLFRQEKARLSHLPNGAVLHHIGSTSVPGLPAKPILDLMVVASIDLHSAIANALIGSGYLDRGHRGGRGGHVLIRMHDGLRTHALHLYGNGDPEVAEHLDFRDALRTVPILRNRYAERKRRLVAEGVARSDYADRKTDTIRSVLEAWRGVAPEW